MLSSRGKHRHHIAALISGVVVLSSGLSACDKFQSADSLVREAHQYHEKGESKAAIIQLKNALQKNPDLSDGRVLLASIYNDLGDGPSAEKEIRKAMSLGADRVRSLSILAQALLLQNQPQKALDELGTQQNEKFNAELVTLRGDAYLAQGNKEAARSAYEQALKVAANHPGALIGLAKLALQDNDMETASRLSDRSVEANPKDADAWFFKGYLLRAQGKAEPALAALDKVLGIKPGDPLAHIAKAELEIENKKFDAARANIDAVKKGGHNSLIALYMQARLEYAQGRPAAALESLQQVMRVAPEHMPSVMLAGAVQLTLGATQQAEQHLRKYLEKNPNNLQATRLLATALLKNGQADRALALIDSTLKRVPEDAQLLALAGDAFMKMKDYNKAAAYFEKASALAPKAAPIHTALGVSHLGQGEYRRAIEELEAATNLDAQAPMAGVLLIMTHVRMKNYDQALAVVQSLEKEQPTNPMVPNLKGAIYLEKKDVAAARMNFEKALAMQPDYFPAAASLAQLDMQEKKPEAAKKRFEAIVEKDKKNMQAFSALASLALGLGKKEEAKVWLERAVKENPNEAQPAVSLAAYHFRLGEKQKALTIVQNFQAVHPNDPDVLQLLGQLQAADKRHDAALESYKKLAILLPTSAEPQFHIATQYVAMQNETAAAEALKKALALQPDYLDAKLAQAAMEMRAKRFEQALQLARQIQAQHNKSPAGYALEGDVLTAQNQLTQAAIAFEQAYALDKTSIPLSKLYNALRRAGREKDAATRLDQWQKANPSDMSVRLQIGTLALANLEYKSAIEHFLVVLKTDPNNVAALNNLAYAYHQEHDAQAIKYAERAYELAPKNAAVVDTLGWILVDGNNLSRGLPLLKQAVSFAPTAPDIRYHLVLGLIKSGDKAKARNELEQVIAQGQRFSKFEEAKELLKTL